MRERLGSDCGVSGKAVGTRRASGWYRVSRNSLERLETNELKNDFVSSDHSERRHATKEPSAMVVGKSDGFRSTDSGGFPSRVEQRSVTVVETTAVRRVRRGNAALLCRLFDDAHPKCLFILGVVIVWFFSGTPIESAAANLKYSVAAAETGLVRKGGLQTIGWRFDRTDRMIGNSTSGFRWFSLNGASQKTCPTFI